MKKNATIQAGRSRVKKFLAENYTGWLFVLPLMFGIAMFTVYPMVQSFLYSFHDYDGLRLYEFCGFDNYIKMFSADGDLAEVMQVFGNTFLYAIISVPLNLILSYLLAVSVNQKIKGVTVFRVLYYMPVVIPGVISGVIWGNMLDPTRSGLFNTIITGLGGEPFPFFTSEHTAMFSAILMNMWTLGGGMVLWLAALKNIPASMYEAAKIDGAGTFKRLLFITVPLSTPMIFYNMVTGVVGAMQTNATMVYASDGGRGPNNSLYFIAVKIYNDGFYNGNYGYASALAWVLFIVIGLLTVLMFKSSKWVYTGDN
jgi:ABC transporter, permease protein